MGEGELLSADTEQDERPVALGKTCCVCACADLGVHTGVGFQRDVFGHFGAV